MKPRSTVNALLAITESLIAARKAARTKQVVAGNGAPRSKVAKLLVESRPLFLRLRTQPAS
jgi:hypothetical protein